MNSLGAQHTELAKRVEELRITLATQQAAAAASSALASITLAAVLDEAGDCPGFSVLIAH